MIQIGIVGAGEAGGELAAAAEEVGREVARRGAAVLTGGLGGVMEAASRGAADEGGVTVGVLPGDSADEANPHVQLTVVTDMGHARNAVIARSGDALVAVGGGLGTLSEVAIGLKSGTPVAVLEAGSEAHRAARELEHDLLSFEGTPAAAVESALDRV